MANEFNIKNGFISNGDSVINGKLTAQNVTFSSGLTASIVSATTYQNLPLEYGSFGISISNGAAILSTGQKGYVKIPYSGTITDWTLMTDVSGSIIIDVWKDTVGSFPPTSLDSITGGDYAKLTNQIINSDNLLTGWTTTFLANDVFSFNIVGVTGITNINLTLNVIKN